MQQPRDSFVKGGECDDVENNDMYVALTGDAVVFSLVDLSEVTNYFSKERMIGKGGFGDVFHARLRHLDVALKSLTRSLFELSHCIVLDLICIVYYII